MHHTSSSMSLSVARNTAQLTHFWQHALLAGACVFALLAIAQPVCAADDLPPLPPLPGMEAPATAAPKKTETAAAPALKEMPALPQVETPAMPEAAQAPALKNSAGLGSPSLPQGLPELPPLPPVSTKEDLARAVANNPGATVETTLPDARNVGPAEIDNWLKSKESGRTASTATALPAPKLPSDIPNTEEKTAELKPVTDEKADVEAKPKKKKAAAVAKKKTESTPFYSFQYKSQFLPDAIYRPTYSADNKHLPKARYEQDYDRYVFQAAARNDAAGLRALLNTPGRSAELMDPSGQSPLMVAVRYGAVQAAQTLLSYGANPDHRDNSGVSVLHYAVLSHNPNMVQALLSARANPYARDPWGQTPLDIAAYTRDAASLQLLQNAVQPQLQAGALQPKS